MRQSEYTTFYERRGNVKYPVRGKLYMRHRGLAVYIRNGVLTEGTTGRVLPYDPNACSEQEVREGIDKAWEWIKAEWFLTKRHHRIHWRSKQGGVITVNGKVITSTTPVQSVPLKRLMYRHF